MVETCQNVRVFCELEYQNKSPKMLRKEQIWNYDSLRSIIDWGWNRDREIGMAEALPLWLSLLSLSIIDRIRQQVFAR
jgi:hypothetical protein